MLADLEKLGLCEGHEGVDFVRGALEVLDGEGVDGDAADVEAHAYLEHLRAARSARGTAAGSVWKTYAAQGDEPVCVPLLDALVAGAGVPAVAVHHEGDVAGDGARSEDRAEDVARAG